MWAYCFKHKLISTTCHSGGDTPFELTCGCIIEAKDIEKHRVHRKVKMMVGNKELVKNVIYELRNIK